MICVTSVWMSTLALSDDWPTFAHDRRRTSTTAEHLDMPLVEYWSYRHGLAPSPAWPPPARQDFWNRKHDLRSRLDFDHAYHAVAADGRVFIGTSSDDRVICLDISDGRVRWSFTSEGPVRMAPSVANGRVVFGSDDGFIYCLSHDRGELIWKRRIGPDERLCLGNGRLISRWPIRSGTVIEEDRIITAAGLFPSSEGVFLANLDLTTGDTVWNRPIKQSAQGYVLLTDQQIVLPSGRTGPTVYDRQSGHPDSDLPSPGGVYAVVDQGLAVAGAGDLGELAIADNQSGEQLLRVNGIHLIPTSDRLIIHTGNHLESLDRARFMPLARKYAEANRRLAEANEQKGAKAKIEQVKWKAELHRVKTEMAGCRQWQQPCDQTESLVLAGNQLLAGGTNEVVAYFLESGRRRWRGSVKGRALGLAVADGRLLVSTDEGSVVCFGAGKDQETGDGGRSNEAPGLQRPRRDRETNFEHTGVGMGPHSKDRFLQGTAPLDSRESRAWADRLTSRIDVDRGFALVTGRRGMAIALALARGTHLRVIILESDRQRIDALRAVLDQRSLYGSRIVVRHATDSFDELPTWFANLIFIDQSTPTLAGLQAYYRLLRPHGGTMFVSPRSSSWLKSVKAESMITQLTDLKIAETKIGKESWLVGRRGALAGEGEWTHGLADPANTACSQDQWVQGPVHIQWFGEPGPRSMADRHHRGVPPLYQQGRLFVPGVDRIFAVDAYNGSTIWERSVPDSVRLGVFLDASNMAVDNDRLYVAGRKALHVLSVETGHEEHLWPLPVGDDQRHYEWGYLAHVGGRLLGSGCRAGAGYRSQSRDADAALWYDHMAIVTSDFLFALDADRGEREWEYRGGRVLNTTLTAGRDRLFFVEVQLPESGEPGAPAVRSGQLTMAQLRTFPARVVALDSDLGTVVWHRDVSLAGYDVLTYLNLAGDKLLLSGNQYRRGHLWYSLEALDADGGETVWKVEHDTGYTPGGGHGEQNRHPTIVGDTVIIYPVAYDLQTGQRREGWNFDRLGHGCGNISASAQAIFWRGANPWRWDFAGSERPAPVNRVTRPGCFINIIPAGGMLLIPEASSGCTCAYPLQTSLGYLPDRTAK